MIVVEHPKRLVQIMAELILIASIWLSSSAWGESDYPIAITLQETSSKSYNIVNVGCDLVHNNQIECSFAQVLVSRAVVSKEDENWKVFSQEWDKATQEERDKGLKMISEVCMGDKWKTLRQVVAERVGNNEDELNSRLHDMEPLLMFCKTPTFENLKYYVKHMSRQGKKTCEMRANAWKETFERQGARRWVSRRGPDGLCEIIRVSSFTHKGGILDWVYETRRIVLRPDALKGFCNFDETPQHFEANLARIEKYMNCVYLNHSQ